MKSYYGVFGMRVSRPLLELFTGMAGDIGKNTPRDILWISLNKEGQIEQQSR